MLPNFVLQSLGARVLKSSEPFPMEVERLTTPSVVIQGQPHLIPGHCWAFAGQQGHLSIALSHQAAISHVTLGHISKASSPTGSISSAPKEFSVYVEAELVRMTPAPVISKLLTHLYLHMRKITPVECRCSEGDDATSGPADGRS
ncbi:SUN domain-containing protein 3-like [Amphiprion ocellaris]|uniref:SUN domain-containing protein 3-like n=1 Tax=Amphiprion ocellaris TaxID=80972 RepID=UPI0024118902|nr:SUN domain-containing protein 3-like [Amphiprion ocellaris]